MDETIKFFVGLDAHKDIGEALKRDVPHPNAVSLALERAREEQGLPPPTELRLSDAIARRDAPVRSHALASYDQIVQASTSARRIEGDQGAIQGGPATWRRRAVRVPAR